MHFENIGRALRFLRNQKGLKQLQVAERADITKGMVSTYELGKTDPSLRSLDGLLTALEVDVYALADALEVVNGRAPRFALSRSAPRPSGAVGGEEALAAARELVQRLYPDLLTPDAAPLEALLRALLDLLARARER